MIGKSFVAQWSELEFLELIELKELKEFRG
jgi:hypothetical protein